MRVLPLLLALALLMPACDDGRDDAPPKHGKKTDVKPNRLATERSPYLRQHRFNPVDWYPWGEEAFAKAKAEDKPILLSVGYAACHWCHVMEHESFEDVETATMLNDAFVCVKVDREERPDVDSIYMSFVSRMTGRGGWPMTVLMTPEAKPFWGGTYLPKAATQQLATRFKALWKDQRKEVLQAAETYAEAVRDMADGYDRPATDDSDAEILKTMRDALGASFDRPYGGYGRTQAFRPKFPPHTDLLYFLDKGGARMGADERDQMFITLDAMERGGIHDQVGGGFHRYSTDRHWLLPHFEKMLYDNALLAQAYAAAYAQTKDARYQRVVVRLFDWLEREMKQEGGGYASSLDADTEGEEGLTYTWTWEELEAALSKEDLAWLAEAFGMRADGNFHDEATHEPTGRNIPHWTKTRADTAKARGISVEALTAEVDERFAALLAVRDKKPQPGLDDKVIVAWNGLLLSAFARAGRDLGEASYLERGRALATFLLEHCRREDGTLLRFPKGSGPEIVGFCEDHAHTVEGLLDLAEATGESRWLDAARELGTRMNALFFDTQKGGFWATSASHHEVLIAQSKEMWDSPIPSDNGVAARANLRLHAATGEAGFRTAADDTLAFYRSSMADPRMAGGITALIRALSDRMEMGGVADTAVQGDVHVRQGVAVVDAFLERGQAAPGARVGLVLRVTLDKGWHVNAAVPSRKELVATALRAADGAVAGLENVRYPEALTKAVGGEDLALYEGSFLIRAELLIPADAPAGPRSIKLLLRVQPCDDASCQAPLEIPLGLPLRFDAETGPRRHPSIFK